MLDASPQKFPLSTDAPDHTRTVRLTSAALSNDRSVAGRKRRRGSSDDLTLTTYFRRSPPIPAKKPPQSQEEAEATLYYPFLFPIVTSCALEEVDRQSRRAANFVTDGTTSTLPVSSAQQHVQAASAVCYERIKRFASHGGPDLRDLRGYPDPATSSYTWTPSRRSAESESTMHRCTAYDRQFDKYLMDDGIHGDVGDPRPANWDEISQRLARRRPSVSGPAFSDEAYKRFADAVETSLSEQMVMMALSSVLSGTAQKPCTGDVRFDNLEQLTSQKLSPARPDLYDGANMMVIDLQVRRELDKYIIPSIRHPAPVLPNFFMEGKGPDGAPAVGQLQARYNGALGARGMRAIQGFGTDCKTHYDGEAYTLTSDFHPFFGGLRIYSVHPVRPKEAGARPEYHMSCIGSWALTVSAQQFRDGICAIRNARDWAKEQRDDAIRAANARVGGGGAGVTPAESVAGSVAGSGRTRRSERS